MWFGKNKTFTILDVGLKENISIKCSKWQNIIKKQIQMFVIIIENYLIESVKTTSI